ncbi:ParB/RepB/Spo0J family partition protein [Ihubacter sp. mB4P-1]|uniref:ParB/RepB/Spo0J family partition protein n=1 Tax=Ihubacter sp. mB4P-1 TaxID=3242370 RepID=UPI00216F9487|nr:ParB/RepB/Spo0J family partition protein [Emergencia sp.]
MDRVDKDALMNAIFLGEGIPEAKKSHPQGEEIIRISPELLVDFRSNVLGRQPYRVKDDENMVKLVQSAKERGILSPLIIRHDPESEDRYEILSGHRRKMAALRADLSDVPVLIKDVDDDEANIIVCDANMFREDVMPSEKAWAYRLKLEAMRRQGKRRDLTSAPVEQKLNGKTSVQLMAEESEDSRAQIQRYIRLTYLLPELLEMVDNGTLKFRIGVELSYLKEPEQEALLDVITCDRVKPTLEQAQQLKQMSREKRALTIDLIHVLLQKPKDSVTAYPGYLNKLLPKHIRRLPAASKQAYTVKALEHYGQYLTKHPEELGQWEMGAEKNN